VQTMFKHLSKIAVLAAVLCWPLAASAQSDWPTKPLRMIVPFPPGGVTDLAARELVKRLNDGAMLIIFS